MERGYEQLFLFAAILIAALIDLTVRWLRRKQGSSQLPDVEDDLVIDDQDDRGEFEIREARPQPAPAPPRPATPARPVSPAPAVLPPIAGADGLRGRRDQRTGRPRREPVRRWLTRSEARRGIILMEILGPCRGLERPAERGPFAGRPTRPRAD